MANQAGHVQFGFYPKRVCLKTEHTEIVTLDDFDDLVRAVHQDSNMLHDDWIYPGNQQRHGFLTGEITDLPYSARVFGLPKTHSICLSNQQYPDLPEFLIWCLGFFEGIRLITSEARFLDATPIKTGKLTDFVIPGNGLNDAMLHAEAFWMKNHSNQLHESMAAIIHVYFISQNPTLLNFEKFIYLYMAFDGCFALAKNLFSIKEKILHSARVKTVCKKLNIECPAWAHDGQGSEGSALSMLRNQTFHEALFAGQPLGFAADNKKNDPNLLEMSKLVCRFIVGLLGINSTYVNSNYKNRQRVSLEVPQYHDLNPSS